jgi:hypothetical protein
MDQEHQQSSAGHEVVRSHPSCPSLMLICQFCDHWEQVKWTVISAAVAVYRDVEDWKSEQWRFLLWQRLGRVLPDHAALGWHVLV